VFHLPEGKAIREEKDGIFPEEKEEGALFLVYPLPQVRSGSFQAMPTFCLKIYPANSPLIVERYIPEHKKCE
jgi:hypothetical protein